MLTEEKMLTFDTALMRKLFNQWFLQAVTKISFPTVCGLLFVNDSTLNVTTLSGHAKKS